TSPTSLRRATRSTRARRTQAPRPPRTRGEPAIDGGFRTDPSEVHRGVEVEENVRDDGPRGELDEVRARRRVAERIVAQRRGVLRSRGEVRASIGEELDQD